MRHSQFVAMTLLMKEKRIARIFSVIEPFLKPKSSLARRIVTLLYQLKRKKSCSV